VVGDLPHHVRLRFPRQWRKVLPQILGVNVMAIIFAILTTFSMLHE
jgi:hypothetical protein